MAIVTEKIKIGKREFMHHYSDRDMQIRQVETGILYSDAIDLVESTYTYDETDIPIEDIEDPEYE